MVTIAFTCAVVPRRVMTATRISLSPRMEDRTPDGEDTDRIGEV